MQGGGRLEDPAAVLAAQAGMVGDEGGRHVAHDHHPAVAGRLGGQHGVLDDPGHPGEHARGPQLGRPAVVMAGPHDPVAPVADVLDDQRLAPGEHDPFQQASRAAVGDRQRLPRYHVGQQRCHDIDPLAHAEFGAMVPGPLAVRLQEGQASGLGLAMYHSRNSAQRPSASKRSRNRLSYSSRTPPLVSR